MFLLRRTATRAIVSTPSKALLASSRPTFAVAPATIRLTQQKWQFSTVQRRFAAEDAPNEAETAAKAAAEAADFAQSTPEAPVEENLTPAQQAAQAPPTDESATFNDDALEAAARGPKRTASSNNAPTPTLYVGNLHYEITEDQIQKIFERFGPIKSTKIVFDNRGLSRGFGYVEFTNNEDAAKAIKSLDMQVFEGRNLVVQFHKPRSPNSKPVGTSGSMDPSPPSKTLFIGNMSFEMSDKDLNDLFRDINNVLDVRVAIDRRTGQPRGFAHADFVDIASATKAKSILADKVIYGRKLRIDYSKTASRQGREDPSQAPSEPRGF